MSAATTKRLPAATAAASGAGANPAEGMPPSRRSMSTTIPMPTTAIVNATVTFCMSLSGEGAPAGSRRARCRSQMNHAAHAIPSKTKPVASGGLAPTARTDQPMAWAVSQERNNDLHHNPFVGRRDGSLSSPPRCCGTFTASPFPFLRDPHAGSRGGAPTPFWIGSLEPRAEPPQSPVGQRHTGAGPPDSGKSRPGYDGATARMDDESLWRAMQGDRLIYVVLDIPEPVASAVTAARQRFSPMRAEYPVEVGVAGSSGVGPIDADQDEGRVFAALAEVAASTSPFEVRFDGVRKFEGTELYYLAPANRAPFDELHSRLATCGIRFHDSAHPYNPHCTISGIELDEPQRNELRALRIDEPFIINRLAVYSEPLPVEEHFAAPLAG